MENPLDRKAVLHLKTFVGHALDPRLRRAATSGGVGSAVLQYLFSTGCVNTALSFDFDAQTIRYSPRLIYKFEDYRPTGSIYQDMDLIGFLRTHIAEINGTFACFCLPCQTASIRILLKEAGHDCVLLGLTCSSQQTLFATECLLRFLRIRKENVETLQYRGNGWPGGIRIGLKNGKSVFVKNNGSMWTDIFHSRLCIPKRCLYCQDTLNKTRTSRWPIHGFPNFGALKRTETRWSWPERLAGKRFSMGRSPFVLSSKSKMQKRRNLSVEPFAEKMAILPIHGAAIGFCACNAGLGTKKWLFPPLSF